MPEATYLLRDLISRGAAFLGKKGIPEGQTLCELLAARLFKCGRLGLYKVLGAPVPPRLMDAMRRGIQRVASGEPVQYVLGQWDFRSLTLKVDPRALVPRPETEQLVEHVLASRQAKAAKPLVVDVGTGTGCIILSLAKEMAGGVFVGLEYVD